MNEISIQINWVYFLGIIFALICVAWYSNGRFTKLETDMEWIKNLLKNLKIDFNNKEAEVFVKQSPVELTPKGEKLLEESGLKKYIADNQESFISKCKDTKIINNAYDVQEYIFNLMDNWSFEINFERKLKKYAYEKGIEIDILRRIAGIYLRNICISKMNLDKQDIDKHEQNKV